MRSPERAVLAILLALTTLAAAPPPALSPASPPQEAGDAIGSEADQRAVLQASMAYFARKDGGDYEAAYAMLAPSMTSYLTRDVYRAESAQFNAEAGRAEARRVLRLTWYRDPPDAPAPGLYVAADFVSRFPNIFLHCGYLMWRREADGGWRIVREEQSFVDNATASRMAPERRDPLPRQFGCVDPAG